MNAPGPSRRWSPKETIDVRVSTKALNENLSLYLHIFQTCMTLHKRGIVDEEAIHNLCGVFGFLVSGEVVIVLAKLDIVGIVLEGLSCHFESIHKLSAIGEEISPLGGSEVSLSGGGGEVVKANVVGNYGVNGVLAHYIFDDVLDGFPSAEHSLTTLDVVPILRDFVLEVGALHHSLVKENVGYHVRTLLVDLAVLVYDGEAKVITNGAFNIVGGFSVKH
jgi:hypothetical protein